MIENKVWTGDCLNLMPLFDDKICDLIFADPPFNIGYNYDVYDDTLPLGEYEQWTRSWIAGCVRMLADHGSMWIAIGDERAGMVDTAARACGLHMRNWVIWQYTFGVHCTTKFGRNHTHLLYYTKSKNNFTFNSNQIRIESERQRIGDARASPHGRVPGDVWDFPRICGTHRERIKGHDCQMPEAILYRIIRACSDPGDLVFDPMCGTGTALAVAKKLGRRYVGFELSEDYANITRRRLDGGRTGSQEAGEHRPAEPAGQAKADQSGLRAQPGG